MILTESPSKQDDPDVPTSTGRKGTKVRQSRFEFAYLTTIIFIFVAVRGPLFQVEDLTELGWNRVYVWRALNTLVKARILEKFDRKSYGITDDTRRWFRAAFGGGVNDAAFAYSTMAVETWSETRLNRFKSKMSEMWQERPERIKQDPARAGFMLASDEDSGNFHTLAKLLCEKVEEASYIASMLEKKASTSNSPEESAAKK
jgi:hypothetical protein